MTATAYKEPVMRYLIPRDRHPIRSTETAEYGLLYSSSSTRIRDDLVEGPYTTCTEAVAVADSVTKHGLQAVVMFRPSPADSWRDVYDRSPEDVIRDFDAAMNDRNYRPVPIFGIRPL